MDTWSLPKALPISCNDCPAFQRHHISVRWFTESFTRLRCAINTTFREKIYSRWCCIDRLSWHLFTECGFCLKSHWTRRPFLRTYRYRRPSHFFGMYITYRLSRPGMLAVSPAPQPARMLILRQWLHLRDENRARK